MNVLTIDVEEYFHVSAFEQIISSHDFRERIAATPVIADGRIYVRTEKALYCFAKP